MDTFSKQEMNHALLGMYVGTRGPKTLRKCIIDKLFTYQMWKNEETIREHLDADMVLLVFPEGQPVPSLDDLDDLVVPDIGSLAFAVSANEHDISKLRNSIQSILEGSVFHKYLQSREKQFRRKNSKTKLLSRIQFTKLYPENGDTNIHHLDITVLCFILFEGMGFRPLTDFDKLPLESVQTEADDMLRIKICKNILVHQPTTEISDGDLEHYWECLTGAFERLLKSPCVRRESERLKSLRLPDEKIEQFKVMIQEWRMDDEGDRKKHLNQMKDIVTQTGLRTETVIQATGTQIVENQNVKHEELVTLFKKSSSKRRRVQNKELKKSFPLRIHGYDKFKHLCHIMHEEGIKYTLPAASSSNDTAPNRDSSLSHRSTDIGILQFEVDREEAANAKSLSLRRSRSLPRYKPRQHSDGVRKVGGTTNNLNSSTDSTANTSQVFESRQQRQWKRSLSEKSRNTEENRSPRPGNAIRMGVRAFNEGKLTVFDWKTNQEYSDTEHEEVVEDFTPPKDSSDAVGRTNAGQSDQYDGTTDCAGDPTGYFLSLLRRDDYIHNKAETNTGDSHHKPVEQSSGNVQHILQTRTEISHLDSCLSNVEEEDDNTSLSATSGEYVLGDDEGQCENALEVGESIRLSSNKGGMYSEDSTGYNTDLLTLNSSVDGNTSSDTLLFQPVRLSVPQSSPIRHRGETRLSKKEGKHIFKVSANPRTPPNATDDGYASNGYFSSLDRNASTTQDPYRVTGSQNSTYNNASSCVVDREDDNFNNHDKTDNRELRMNNHAPEVERLIEDSKEKRKKGFSIGNCLRSCIFCGGKEPDLEQDSSIIVKENLRRRESERCLLSSRDSAEVSEPTGTIQLSESQHLDTRCPHEEDELKEIFV